MNPFKLGKKAVRLAGAFGALAGRPKSLPVPTDKGRILWLSSGPQGSLGEEALLVSAVGHASMKEFGHTVAFLYGDPPESLSDVAPDVRLVRLSASGPSRATTRAWKALVAEHELVYLIGADTLDGNYSDFTASYLLGLLRFGARSGRRCRVISTSLAETIKPLTRRAWQRLPRDVAVVLRDRLSHARYEELTARKAVLAADVAWLLEPASGMKVIEALKWIDTQRKQSRTVVAVSPGLHAFRGRPASEVIQAFARQIGLLEAVWGKVPIVVVPHDVRPTLDGQSDEQVCRQLTQVLESKKWPVFQAAITDCRAAKKVVAATDFVVTSRFHVCIAALSSGKPALALAYQGKVEGLYSAAGIDGWVVSPEEFVGEDILATLTPAKVLAANEALGPRVAQMKELATLNLWDGGKG